METIVSLLSLAMLKVNAEEQKQDYLDYLLPFIREELASRTSEVFTETSVQTGIRDHYGLRVPLQTIALCLKRLARAGELDRRDGTYHVKAELAPSRLSQTRASTLSTLQELVKDLSLYASSAHNAKWSTEQTTEALTTYLSRFGIECLRAYAQRTALPKITKTTKSSDFIVNSYIRYLQEASLPQFDSIVVLVKGTMLANALLCPDLASTTRKFSNLTVFLDTPFVLRLLELSSKENYEAAKEIVDLIKQLGGKVAIFSHTATEVYGVIRACATHMDDPRARGALIREMRERGVTSVDLILMASALDAYFANLGIAREETPKYDKTDFQIDEKVLESALDEDIHYLNPRALQHDINSIRSIYALRAGREPSSLEDSVAVLLTTNSALARRAYIYGLKMESSREISPAITDFSLANIAWLKVPFAATNLPRLEVLALCYAALRPPETLWRKYVRAADDLKRLGHITARDHALLRSSLSVQRDLMNLTLGSEENLTHETVSEVLTRLKTELTREVESKYAADATSRNRILLVEQEEHRKTKAEKERLEKIQKHLLHEHRHMSRRLVYLTELAGKCARVAVFALFFVAIVLASFAAGEVGKSEFNIPRTLSVPLLVLFLSGLGHILFIAHELFGFSVAELANKAGQRVQFYFLERIENFIHPKETLPFTTLGISDPVETLSISAAAEQGDAVPEETEAGGLP